MKLLTAEEVRAWLAKADISHWEKTPCDDYLHCGQCPDGHCIREVNILEDEDLRLNRENGIMTITWGTEKIQFPEAEFSRLDSFFWFLWLPPVPGGHYCENYGCLFGSEQEAEETAREIQE